MRLNCEILVVNRVAGSLNMRTLSKPTRASVAIGRKESLKTHIGGKEITVFLLICTAKEKNGTKYKVYALKLLSYFSFKGVREFVCIYSSPTLSVSFAVVFAP